MSLKKKLMSLGLIGTLTLIPLNSKAEEWIKICKYNKYNNNWIKVCKYVPYNEKHKNQDNNKTLYQSKQQNKTKEFTPPEYPYCRIVKANGRGIILEYWDENKNYYELAWSVEDYGGDGGTSAYVDLQASYTTDTYYGLWELKSRDKARIQSCLIEAARKIFDRPICPNGGCGNPYDWIVKRIYMDEDFVHIYFEDPSY